MRRRSYVFEDDSIFHMIDNEPEDVLERTEPENTPFEAAQAEAAQPETAQPETAQAEAAQSETAQSEAAQAEAAQPEAMQAGVPAAENAAEDGSRLYRMLRRRCSEILKYKADGWQAPAAVCELSKFMAEHFIEIAPFIGKLRASLCDPDPAKRYTFKFDTDGMNTREVIQEAAHRLSDAGCFNHLTEIGGRLTGKLCATSMVNAFITGNHAEIYSHVATREVVKAVAQALGKDWEVFSNVEVRFADGGKAELDEIIRIGGQIFIQETKTLNKNVDLMRFHEVGEKLTANDPSHLIFYDLRAQDSRLEQLHYFHGFYAANTCTYRQTLSTCLYSAFGAEAPAEPEQAA